MPAIIICTTNGALNDSGLMKINTNPTTNSTKKYVVDTLAIVNPKRYEDDDPFLVKNGVSNTIKYAKCMNAYDIHTLTLCSVPPTTKNTTLKTKRNTKSNNIPKTIFFLFIQ